MELNYLKEFVILAETGNYIEAAESLFISQSSLSKHIQSLEKELGIQLFDRTTRKVTLNQYGKVFLEYAKKMTTLQYQYKTELINMVEREQHSLKIGSLPIMVSYGITDAILRFKQENNGFSINVIEGESSELKKLLRTDQCELAFIREENDNSQEFSKISFTDDRLVAILPTFHRLADAKTLTIEELKDENFLLLQPGTFLYNICIKECKKYGFAPNIAYTGQRAENIIDLVEKGMGVSFLMAKPIMYLANKKIVIIDISPKISTEIKIYYKRGAVLSEAAQNFINYIKH